MADLRVANIHAVIVTYHPKIPSLTKCVDRLREQVGQIVVIDNDSDNVDEIRNVVESMPRAQLVALRENRGLGHAHNLGIRVASESGATHVLLLDQDSIPHADMLVNMLAILKQLSDDGHSVAAIGARYVGSHVGNESFVERAPPEIVAKERARNDETHSALEQLRSQRETIETL